MRAEISASRVPFKRVRLLQGGYSAVNARLNKIGKNHAAQLP